MYGTSTVHGQQLDVDNVPGPGATQTCEIPNPGEAISCQTLSMPDAHPPGGISDRCIKQSSLKQT